MPVFFESRIKPRFSETDLRGHISNTVVPVWLGEGRSSLCREYLRITQPWVVVNLNVDYKNEMIWGSFVTIKTAVEKIGNSSICFAQEIWQGEQLCINARTTVVAFDMNARRSSQVSDHDRSLLTPYMLSSKS